MSFTITTYPIVGAIVATEKIIGPKREWQPSNDLQKEFLREFFSVCRDEIAKIPEIESLAAKHAAPINEFLKQHGFSIQIGEPLLGGIAAASIFQLVTDWIKPGDVTELELNTKKIPAVKIPNANVEFFRASNHQNPITSPKTKSGDKVYMTIIDNPPTGFELVKKVQALSSAKEKISEFGSLIFPMISLEEQPDISWLAGLKTTAEDGTPQTVNQAVQETKLKLDEKGAQVESAAAISTVGAHYQQPKPDYIIDKPFLIWFERDGLIKPFFVGYITEEDWKRPNR